ncbi:MAG: hypothetical protein ACKOFP_04315, partial [Actinomycetota bacterium]
MARVHFTVRRHLPLPARVAFDELVDWRGHAEWVPMTRVVIESGDGGAGTTFVATTGLGPLALPDRMRVESLDATQMTVHIVKIGPVLTGDVRLAVEPVTDDSSDITWMNPLWKQFWDLDRPTSPTATDALRVIRDAGYD